MPPNFITPLSVAGGLIGNFPFRLIAGTVKPSLGIVKADFNCNCPCSDTAQPGAKWTASKLFQKFLTDDEKKTLASSTNPNEKALKSITIYKESYLFRGFIASKRLTFSSTDLTALTEYGTHNNDPVLKIYGLDRPIIVDQFFQGEPETTTKTLKLWLTVCFPSGDLLGLDSMSSCSSQDVVKNDVKTNLKCSLRSQLPQVAFISAGLDMPTNLVTVRNITFPLVTGNPPLQRVERRAVAAHVPLGEVNYAGKVVAQYVKNNLTLTDVCNGGVPVKYPMPVFD